MKRARILSLSLMLSMLTGFSASAAKVLDIKSGLTVENSVTTEPSISVSESESEISISYQFSFAEVDSSLFNGRHVYTQKVQI